MSRTYRKRTIKFENTWRYNYYDRVIHIFYWTKYDAKYIERDKALYYSDKLGNHAEYKLPKEFRNTVNRQRRAYDKNELFRELNSEYEPLYCLWNCKTSNSYSYW